MIERALSFDRKPGRSNLQKLVLYYGQQRRILLGARAQLELMANRDKIVKQQCHDAIIALDAALGILKNEYARDRGAIMDARAAEDAARTLSKAN
jgi:hypothetical protein